MTPIQRFRMKPTERAAELSQGKKTCPGCNTQKWIGEFGDNRTRPDGLQSRCKACKNSENRVRRYGLSPEDFESRKAEQSWKCAMCGKPCEDWHVDHNHSCCPGAKSCGSCVQGLLCGPCNRGLGYFEKHREDAERYLGEAL